MAAAFFVVEVLGRLAVARAADGRALAAAGFAPAEAVRGLAAVSLSDVVPSVLALRIEAMS